MNPRFTDDDLALLADGKVRCSACKGDGRCLEVREGRPCGLGGNCHGCGGAKVVQAHADDYRAAVQELRAHRRALADDTARAPYDPEDRTALDGDGMIGALQSLVAGWRSGTWNRGDMDTMFARIYARRLLSKVGWEGR